MAWDWASAVITAGLFLLCIAVLLLIYCIRLVQQRENSKHKEYGNTEHTHSNGKLSTLQCPCGCESVQEITCGICHHPAIRCLACYHRISPCKCDWNQRDGTCAIVDPFYEDLIREQKTLGIAPITLIPPSEWEQGVAIPSCPRPALMRTKCQPDIVRSKCHNESPVRQRLHKQNNRLDAHVKALGPDFVSMLGENVESCPCDKERNNRDQSLKSRLAEVLRLSKRTLSQCTECNDNHKTSTSCGCIRSDRQARQPNLAHMEQPCSQPWPQNIGKMNVDPQLIEKLKRAQQRSEDLDQANAEIEECEEALRELDEEEMVHESHCPESGQELESMEYTEYDMSRSDGNPTEEKHDHWADRFNSYRRNAYNRKDRRHRGGLCDIQRAKDLYSC